MGNVKKTELLMLIKSFEETNRKIEKNQLIDVEMLVQCQTQAVELGEYIEVVYPDIDIADTIYKLEEYCECLYQLSQQEDNKNLRKLTKKIRKLIIGIQNDIHYKLPKDKKVIVFLPYKASMWDSLESIYFAAKEDKNAEVYVVPIPYFDKKPDGSFGKMHYEADLYPDYVEITAYQQYHLSEEEPDVIYIHNPYDNWNAVTSIHPDFYAKNLCNYTKKLIYIPYFVLGEIEPNDKVKIDNMKHFCFTPGIIYADKVILQSENMRQIYINEYKKAAMESGLQGDFIDQKCLEKKFLGLGSPKFDGVLTVKKENIKIPKEWKKYIKKIDGNNKKIVMYNNSISALLKNSDKMLKKMEQIFEIFKIYQNEITLWWRPHPLIQSTIQSMRPALWKEYKKIVDRYIREDWGIYDDTANVERAIVYSDAYYGDWSSVVHLYEKTGKPIMIVDCEIKYKIGVK